MYVRIHQNLLDRRKKETNGEKKDRKEREIHIYIEEVKEVYICRFKRNMLDRSKIHPINGNVSTSI